MSSKPLTAMYRMNRLPANQKYRRHAHRWTRDEKAQPGHRLQVDVKFLERIAGTRRRFYQFTAIDDCTRIRVLKVYDACTQRTAIAFIDEVRRRLPFRIHVVQTDNGAEFQSHFHWHLDALDIRHVYMHRLSAARWRIRHPHSISLRSGLDVFLLSNSAANIASAQMTHSVPQVPALPDRGAAAAGMAKVRHAIALAISVVVSLVTAFFVWVGAIAVAELVSTIPRLIGVQVAYDRGDISWQEYLVVGVYQNAIVVAVVLYVGLYVLPFIVALPIASPVVLLWEEPARLLFLRPFNRRPLTRGLSRLVRSDVARFGHVYTLADADLRVRWYVRIPALLGQIALLSFRARKIERASRLIRLERAVDRTWLRNINWCVSWRKVFPVASADGCWQQVVERLVRRSSLIFIDLTEARPNVLWEIELIRRLGLESRVMWLLALNATTVEAGNLGPPAGEPIFRYDDSGIVDRTAFGEALARRVWDARQALPSRRTSRALSIAALIMFSLGCFPLLGLWFEGSSEGLASLAEGLPWSIFYFGLLTLGAFAVAAIRNRNAIFFVTVQTVLLLGAFLGPLPLELL